ncbi:MAG: 8-amino-7-oxononanoate synthase, partial [Elusimicrobia bacterium]|nr:8-amino-7-oxononanoate synthase [Elusimicrobiota bacterium]
MTTAFSSMSFIAEELEQLRRSGLYRRLRILETSQQAVSVIDGKKVVNLTSNNYLGLTTHPKLMAAAKLAIEELGVGTAAVRSIIG